MEEEQVSMHKMMLWEQAKGQLRAMAVVDGHRRLCVPMTVDRDTQVRDRWLELDKAIEDFIASIEDEGLHE